MGDGDGDVRRRDRRVGGWIDGWIDIIYHAVYETIVHVAGNRCARREELFSRCKDFD